VQPTYARSLAPAGYEETFAKFDAANGAFVWTWNWSAFLGGAFWCFAKGMWKRGILICLAYILVGYYGLGVLPFVCGTVCNWLYYRAQRDGIERWFYTNTKGS
jgi:hypothetical protein